MRYATNNKISNTEAPPQKPGMNPGDHEGMSTY